MIVVFTRLLTPAQYGQYALGFSAMALAHTLCFTWLEAAMARFYQAEAAGEAGLAIYERLRKNKGERVVVGVEHGACGGCHMRLPAQVVLECRSNQSIVTCPNCGRILYYTGEMDMAVAE